MPQSGGVGGAAPALAVSELTAEILPGRIGVVDIGSNTVRLVVYDAPARLPIPMFNEKVQCALGLGMDHTGRLNPNGVVEAKRSLARYVRLSEAMGVERLTLVATAAVRDAEDGPDFVANVEDAFGLPVQVLSGEEEARSAALGLLSGVPHADGLLGDLGGGSLDLVALDRGAFGEYATLPLGHLRLAEAAGDEPQKAAKVIDKRLSKLPWLETMTGRSLYAVGGAWRALARVFIDQIGYPLHVVDNFTIARDQVLTLSDVVAHLSLGTSEKIRGVPRRRMAQLPYAAMVLEALLDIARPREVVFSGFGMREGQMMKLLPEELRGQDPLISGCTGTAERTGRFSINGDEILAWMAPLFPDEPPAERRLRLAACLLSDIGWSEHPDYRAEHAFHRVLRIPYAGLSHPDRVFLALAVFVRYNGDPYSPVPAPVLRLLDERQIERAEIIGLALRLGHTIAGSAPGLLPRAPLVVNDSTLTLDLPEDNDVFVSETVERRFHTVARAMGLEGRIST